MNLIAAATFFELKPLIDHFQPEKLIAPLKSKRFKPALYRKNNTLLTVAGVGPVCSLPYLQYLMTAYNVEKFLVIGSCGGAPEMVGKWCYGSEILIDYPGALWGIYRYQPPVPRWVTAQIDGKRFKTVSDPATVSPGDSAAYDMESGFWVNLARINKIPVYLFKKVTDSGEKSPEEIAASYREDIEIVLELSKQLINS